MSFAPKQGSIGFSPGLYVFSVVCGPQGHESIAQGSPWVIPPTKLALTRRYSVAPSGKTPGAPGLEVQGVTGYGGNRPRAFKADRGRILSPFIRAKQFILAYQGKPWAKLSCPLRGGAFGLQTTLVGSPVCLQMVPAVEHP
jgi:hypothetical protein